MDISNQVIEVLDHIGSKLGVAVDWSQENVLPYLQELTTRYISWEVHTSKMWLAVGVISGLLAVTAFVLAHFSNKNDWGDIGDFWATTIAILGICFLVIAVTMILCQTFDIITCNHFPEKLIIDYLRSFL